jgi:hypothetical protein
VPRHVALDLFLSVVVFDISGIPMLSWIFGKALAFVFLFERSLDAVFVSKHTSPNCCSDFVLYPCSSWQLALCGEKNE